MSFFMIRNVHFQGDFIHIIVKQVKFDPLCLRLWDRKRYDRIRIICYWDSLAIGASYAWFVLAKHEINDYWFIAFDEYIKRFSWFYEIITAMKIRSFNKWLYYDSIEIFMKCIQKTGNKLLRIMLSIIFENWVEIP